MYFVIQIQKLLDGTYASAIFSFDNIESAKQNYHYFLSASIGSTNLNYCMSAIMAETGKVIDSESWYRPAPDAVEVEE